MLKGYVISKYKNEDAIKLIGNYPNISIEGFYESVEENFNFDGIDFLVIDPLVQINKIWFFLDMLEKYHPSIFIVILSNNPNYAIKMFNYNVIDYVLRPYSSDRLLKTINRFLIYKGNKEKGKYVVKFKQFKSFKMYIDGKYVRLGNNKVTELLAFLAHNIGNPVDWETIVENIWSEYDYEKGHGSLHVTSHKLRKKLNELSINDIYEVDGGNYSLNPNICIFDKKEFEKKLHRKEYLDAYKLYNGAYLENNNFDWAINERITLEKKYEKLCDKLIK